MKLPGGSKLQSGFFDLGISLLVLAVAGGVVWGTENARTERLAAQRPESVIGQNEQTAMAEFSGSAENDSGLQ